MTELEELRNDAYENSRIYKPKIKAFYGKNILRKAFEPNQKVYLYDFRLHKNRGNGAVEIGDPNDDTIFKENGQRLKIVYEQQVPVVEEIPLVDSVYYP